MSVDCRAALTLRRGAYDQIESAICGKSPQQIIADFKSVLPEVFVQFDKKSRGDALNLDLYGWDRAQEVAVIQIRHAFRRYRNGYLNVHKDYVLVGVNEGTGAQFRHPVSAHAVRAAIRKAPENPGSAVHGAQRWMWGVTERQLACSLAAGQRQGDILLVRERAPSEEDIAEEMPGELTIADSHVVRARRIVRVRGGRILAENPTLWHAKNQHAAVFADREGWYSVRAAESASTWRWGVRLGD